MREKSSVLVAVIMVLSLALLSACAEPPEGEVEPDGVWCYKEAGLWKIEIPYYAPEETFFFSAAYDSVWTGTFTGESSDGGAVVSHGKYWPGEFLTFVSTSLFEDALVGGVSGGLQIDAVGDRPDENSDWRGTWAVTAGTGDLEGLRAHGTFWGPGYKGGDKCGEIYYLVEEMSGIDPGDD
ncbi:MAG: hypothetical protein PVH41_12875 [Anaerolineae bacterium]|jgi:hypothetical protein